jgi:hypothetical protein
MALAACGGTDDIPFFIDEGKHFLVVVLIHICYSVENFCINSMMTGRMTGRSSLMVEKTILSSMASNICCRRSHTVYFLYINCIV